MAVGIAVMAANLSAAAWGTAAWARHSVSVWFWYLLRTAQVVVVIQVTLGLFLLIGQSKRADQGLHYLYGIAPLVVALVTEAMRADAARREIELAGIDDVEALERPRQVAIARRVALGEMGIMTIGTLLILTLALRAYQTGT